MAYRFRKRERVQSGVRRIVREQIDAALPILRQPPSEGVAEAVHSVRTCCKKLRAIVRLMRSELPRRTYRKENACFRDAAAKLSTVRDAHVAVQTLAGLIDHYKKDLPAQPFGQARDLLAARAARVQDEHLDQGPARAEAAEALAQAQERVADWPVKSFEFAALRPGLERAYRQGRKAYAKAYKDPRDDNFHEWRKRVKEMWYDLRLLTSAWPPVLDALARQARQLGDFLGDDHDLTVLRDAVNKEPVMFGPPEDVNALLALIDRRRSELRTSARGLARRFYAEKTPAFTDRIAAYWQAWRPKRRKQITRPASPSANADDAPSTSAQATPPADKPDTYRFVANEPPGPDAPSARSAGGQ
jgi:CHAD domain-containing protein